MELDAIDAMESRRAGRDEAVQVFRFEPSRLELLANGESTDGIWDRFEWTRDADGAWSEPRRLMPY